ncbi:acrylyl-CoA reductase family protein [Paenibacillus dakarensis]|uniref:acrylyl-CoA reductase family protein n=1 Tax=Paenibacillus dakarensis TaxID=1527293 RepID=UPI0006D5314C|nr:acryloyl-CoA reductase [Paenibacillus dakarensis]
MSPDIAFNAFVVRNDDQGFRSGIESWRMHQLPEGDVTIRVHYSGVNYKDGLASTPKGKIVRRYPFIPGIDFAGTVVESSHPSFKEGDEVLCTGYETGVSHEGGYSQYTRTNGDWLLHLPEGLTLKEAMGIGTAGFTAALSIVSLIQNGISPGDGPVLVTGATGGVGSFAVSILSKLGFHVSASTGKASAQGEWLRSLGARHVITREEINEETKGVLSTEKWAAVIDPVGGSQLSGLLKHMKYNGAIALSGLTGGGNFDTTVYPFILRGVKLLGIDSVYCPMDLRKEIWGKLAGAWKPDSALQSGIHVHSLEELPALFTDILNGRAAGRSIIAL